MATWTFIVVLAAVVGLYICAQKLRRNQLLKKYGDPAVVELMMKKTIWEGETSEQLVDSIGKPLDVDEHVLRTKVKQVWKYQSTGKKRYGLRVIIENGVVVGWDKKN